MARKKLTKVAEQAPSREAWQRLYTAAAAFKAAAPWELMTEDEIFGVEDPETGIVNYCLVTGELGEHHALIVTLGPQGLGEYYDAIRRMQISAGPLEQEDAGFCMMAAPQIQASFEDRDFLTDDDLQIIKSLGLRFRGPLAWPMFRYYKPGRAPWYVEREAARILTLALEQALQVYTDVDWIDEQYEDHPDELDDRLPVRYFDGNAWAYRWDVSNPMYPQYEYPINEEQLTNIAQQIPTKKARWELHMTVLPDMVQEGPLPPYLPYMLLLADNESGLLLNQKVLLAQPSLEAMLQALPQELLAMFEQLNMRPQQLFVATERLQRILTPTLAHLGVQLKRLDALPVIEDALNAFRDFLESDDLDDEDWGADDWDLTEWDVKEAA